MSQSPVFQPTSAGDQDFVRLNLQQFAATAQSGHRQAGRGVIVVTPRQPDIPDSAGLIEYVSESQADTIWPGRGWPEQSAALALQQYDPKKSFLVMFVDPDTKAGRLHRFDNPVPPGGRPN